MSIIVTKSSLTSEINSIIQPQTIGFSVYNIFV